MLPRITTVEKLNPVLGDALFKVWVVILGSREFERGGCDITRKYSKCLQEIALQTNVHPKELGLRMEIYQRMLK